MLRSTACYQPIFTIYLIDKKNRKHKQAENDYYLSENWLRKKRLR